MKKFLFVVACVSVLLLTGCGSEAEKGNKPTPDAGIKKMVCTRTANQNGMEMDLKYTVSYKDNYVTTVESHETIKIEDKDILDVYKKSLEETIENYKGIEHYDTDLKVDGNVITSTTKIDYTKIDVDKLIERDSSLKLLIKDGKINIEDMENVYNQIGVICEK